MKEERSILVVIFFASLASLAFEITLIRIFSISLSYHFACMVISIAMLGIGASGTALSLFPRGRDIRYIPLYTLFLGASIPLSYLTADFIPFEPAQISWDRMQVLYIGMYSLVLSLPFFCFGLVISTAFSNLSRQSGQIYAADLTGAGIGSLITLLLLLEGGPEKAVFSVATLPLFTVLLFPGRTIKALSVIFILTICMLLFINPQFVRPRISSYKPLPIALLFPGAKQLQTYFGPYSRVDILTSPMIRFAPGLSFKYLGSLPEQIGVSVDAGNLSAITDERDKDRLAFIDFLPSSLPYMLSRKEDVLVLEPMGGMPVLVANHFKAGNVYCVQSDPLVIHAVREYARRLKSTLYRENTWSGLGRSWLASRTNTFDVIDISMMGSLPHAAFGFAEDYRFTIEAFQTYLERLRPDGILSINLFILPPPRTELRLIASIAAAFERLGMAMLPEHIAAVRSWDSLTLIVKKSVLTGDDISKIKQFSRKNKFDLVYYPGIKPEESNVYIKMPGNEYFDAFQHLISPETRQQFINDHVFDIRPVYDENPFFHYYLKLKNLGTIYRTAGGKWHYFVEEGYLLPILFVEIMLACAALILLPIKKMGKRAPGHTTATLFLTALYFGSLGLGFMFVEVSFIQKTILALETPPYAMSTVILGILSGSGAGSLLSERVAWLKNHRMILVLAVVLLLYSFSLPFIMQAVIKYPLQAKIALIFIIVWPAGMLMGIPFPLGLSQMGKRNPDLIPWAWAVNGCFSVLAPVLSVMIALSTGFGSVILTGAALYSCAFFAFTIMKSREIL